jgi:hypothetical protein
VAAPASRWTLAELRKRVAPLLIQTARAASSTVSALGAATADAAHSEN